ncbi:hypothetical protein BK816_06930 [Boudabousia tangfeifanii]|uniref:THIF-type NAD/FAD binding fold domain-containing protein n=1 Tax=Boudabousia tangfeifanii TaxID=1912795 RepID=A0A1D9MLK7_9ACTO|nr:HesA/MoeB/ThiF family protein [Boudabousia tangfeifanii]AOZ73053.1 hypothetical protein BK816_06930 [Boudabousia tangfeifanii]
MSANITSSCANPLEIRPRDLRNVLLEGFGEEGQRALYQAKVLVVGAGGLGSPVLTYLAAAGVGHLGICEFDVIEESNLQRQFLHPYERLGQGKAESARETLQAFAPDLSVDLLGKFPLLAEGETLDNSWIERLSSYQLIVDAADNFETKYSISRACEQLGVPHVWGSIVGWDFSVSVFTPAQGKGLRALFPAIPPAGSTPTGAANGVLGAACGQAGGVMAGEVVKFLTGAGELLTGQVLLVDTLRNSWQTVPFVPLVDSK